MLSKPKTNSIKRTFGYPAAKVWNERNKKISGRFKNFPLARKIYKLPSARVNPFCLPDDCALGKCRTHIIVQGTATVSSGPSISYHPMPELLHHLSLARAAYDFIQIYLLFLLWCDKKRLRMRNRLKRKECACATSFYIPQAKKQQKQQHNNNGGSSNNRSSNNNSNISNKSSNNKNNRQQQQQEQQQQQQYQQRQGHKQHQGHQQPQRQR
jgi:hypothetical protein